MNKFDSKGGIEKSIINITPEEELIVRRGLIKKAFVATIPQEEKVLTKQSIVQEAKKLIVVEAETNIDIISSSEAAISKEGNYYLSLIIYYN